MPHIATVIRCELPTPDMIVVNHPQRGTLLYADHRVTEDRIRDAIAAIDSHIALHPADWHPNPHGRGSAAGA